MKVLVTGANGLLGAHVVRKLLSAGAEVKAFVRPSADIKVLGGLSCEIFRGDILHREDVVQGLAGCTHIVHAASSTSVFPHNFDFYKTVNVDATENVIHASLLYPGIKLVYVSTAQTFGPGPKKNPGTERSPFTLEHYHSGYINSKQMAQQRVLDAVKTRGLDALIVNPTFIIGAYDAKPSSGKLILFALKKGIQWCPEGGKNFVYAGDVANGIYRALLSDKKGECYLLTGENLTYREFFALVNKIAGRSPIQIRLPRYLVRGAGSLVDYWSYMSKRKFAFTSANGELLTLDNYYSGEKATRAFNVSPTPIEEALQETIGWFRKEKYISEDNYSIHGTSLDL